MAKDLQPITHEYIQMVKNSIKIAHKNDRENITEEEANQGFEDFLIKYKEILNKI